MGVTFTTTAEADDAARAFTLTCTETDTVLGTWAGYRNAYSEAAAHGLLCTGLCAGYGADVEEVRAAGDPIPVNVTSRNALDLLAALGYPVALPNPDAETVLGIPPACEEIAGEEDADAFLGRVELALAVGVADADLAPVTWTERIGGAVYTDCGRRAGWMAEKLGELRALALACRAAGAGVRWY